MQYKNNIIIFEKMVLVFFIVGILLCNIENNVNDFLRKQIFLNITYEKS